MQLRQQGSLVGRLNNLSWCVLSWCVFYPVNYRISAQMLDLHNFFSKKSHLHYRIPAANPNEIGCKPVDGISYGQHYLDSWYHNLQLQQTSHFVLGSSQQQPHCNNLHALVTWFTQDWAQRRAQKNWRCNICRSTTHLNLRDNFECFTFLIIVT